MFFEILHFFKAKRSRISLLTLNIKEIH